MLFPGMIGRRAPGLAGALLGLGGIHVLVYALLVRYRGWGFADLEYPVGERTACIEHGEGVVKVRADRDLLAA